MTHPDAVEWNHRYTSDPQRSTPGEPHQLLTNNAHLLPAKGLALDIACGLCSSGLFLASRGWHVIGLDVSENALWMAQAQAHKKKLDASFVVMDLADPWLPVGHFDTILNFYFLSRPLLERYRTTIKPGGLLFFETFVWQPGIEIRPEHYLQTDELRSRFLDWEILFYKETGQTRHSSGTRRVARLVARRPLSQV
jgi:SAM-dependent methyltransferase